MSAKWLYRLCLLTAVLITGCSPGEQVDTAGELLSQRTYTLDEALQNGSLQSYQDTLEVADSKLRVALGWSAASIKNHSQLQTVKATLLTNPSQTYYKVHISRKQQKNGNPGDRYCSTLISITYFPYAGQEGPSGTFLVNVFSDGKIKIV